MIANMMGFGGFSGGLRFSAGNGAYGHGGGFPGFARPYGTPHPAPFPPAARPYTEPYQSGPRAQPTPRGLPAGAAGVSWNADNLEMGPYRESTEEARAWNLWR